MEERDQLLIEGYLANQLSASERAEVEQRMKDDPVFQQEVMDYELTKQALQIRKREELRERFKARDAHLDSGTPNSKAPGSRRIKWIWLFVIIVLVLVIWKLFFSTSGPNSEKDTDARDTTYLNEPPRIDSLTNPDLKQPGETKDDEKQSPQKLDMANAAKEGEELFAEYFEPYKDETLTPVSRSAPNEMTPLDKFRMSYWNGKHQETISHFSTLSPDLQRNDNLRFVYANSLMALNRDNEARIILLDIIAENRAEYLNEAIWYVALNFLKQGDVVNSRKYLQQTIDAPDGYHKVEAKMLLEKLK